MKKKGIDRIKQITDKGINLTKKVTADNANTNSVPIDTYLNRCVSYIEEVKREPVPVEHSVDKHTAVKLLYNIYRHLQQFKGIERQEYNEKRTIGLEEMSGEDEERTLESAVAYSGGGQGFAHVNWNAALLMSTHGKEEERFDPYWRPTKVKPVREVDPSEYDGIMAEHEANRKQTYAEWKKDMEKQKKNLLQERRESL